MLSRQSPQGIFLRKLAATRKLFARYGSLGTQISKCESDVRHGTEGNM
jgi:hypothetical protein